MVKYLSFGDSSFCLKILFNVNGKVIPLVTLGKAPPWWEAVNSIGIWVLIAKVPPIPFLPRLPLV